MKNKIEELEKELGEDYNCPCRTCKIWRKYLEKAKKEQDEKVKKLKENMEYRRLRCQKLSIKHFELIIDKIFNNSPQMRRGEGGNHAELLPKSLDSSEVVSEDTHNQGEEK